MTWGILIAVGAVITSAVIIYLSAALGGRTDDDMDRYDGGGRRG